MVYIPNGNPVAASLMAAMQTIICNDTYVHLNIQQKIGFENVIKFIQMFRESCQFWDNKINTQEKNFNNDATKI